MFSYKYTVCNYLYVQIAHQVKGKQHTKNEMSSDSWEQQTKETAADRTAPKDNSRQRKQTKDKDVDLWM